LRELAVFLALSRPNRLVSFILGRNIVRWRELIGRWGRVYEELIGHIVTMVIVILGFWIVESWAHFLLGGRKLLFSIIPWSWLMDAAHVYAFVAFVYSGTTQAIRAYKGEL